MQRLLWVAFLTVGLLLGLALLMTWRAGSHVSTGLNNIVQQGVPRLQTSYEVSVDVGTVARALRDAVLVEMQEELPDEMKKVEEANARIDAHMSKLQALVDDPEALASLEAIRKAAELFRKDQAVFFDQLAGGNRGAARGLLTGQLRKSQAEYLKTLEEFRAAQEALLQQNSASASSALRDMAVQVGAAFSVVALAGLFIAVALMRLLRRRLGAEPLLVAGAMARVATGDLTPPLPGQQAPQDSVIGSLRLMVDDLATTVVEVRHASVTVSSHSKELVGESRNLAQRTEQQSAELQQAAAALEQFSATMAQSQTAVERADTLARKAHEEAQRSQELVDQTMRKMAEVVAHGARIAATTEVIDGVAFQTNILSLNASVEAARAGERGEGFAVVAGEVRSLALSTASSAKQIRQLILDSNERIHACKSMIEQANQQTANAMAAVKSFAELMGRVARATGEQTQGVQHLNEALSRIDQFTQRNASLVDETSNAAERLHEQAERLESVVMRFRVEDDVAEAVRA